MYDYEYFFCNSYKHRYLYNSARLLFVSPQLVLVVWGDRLNLPQVQLLPIGKTSPEKDLSLRNMVELQCWVCYDVQHLPKFLLIGFWDYCLINHGVHVLVDYGEFPLYIPILLWGSWCCELESDIQSFFLNGSLQVIVLSTIITADSLYGRSSIFHELNEF
jgi:hypothetical protein